MSTETTEYTAPDSGGKAAAAAQEFETEHLEVSMGPSHPSTHGVLRLNLELDGEIVKMCDPVLGYLHRGDEKIAENMTYNQFVPYTDRLDYLAPLANNAAYAMAVEKLAALTVFMITFTEREKLYKLFEELTGARFTTSYSRIGGVTRDMPEGWTNRVLTFCEELLPLLDDVESLLTRNRIWFDRTADIGIISKEDAVAYGLTGPNLRGSGVDVDLRRDVPYSGYEQYEFEVPLGENGDCYDRYAVRVEEMRQSVRIVRQAIKKMPGGAFYAEDAKKIYAPRKDKILTSMEELIQNFMITTEGPDMPAGEVYFEAENPKGALGFYIVSKGGGVPYRMKIRGPSFNNLSILEKVSVGAMISDISAILGSLDFVMGECDR